jgi:hypothetical protein
MTFCNDNFPSFWYEDITSFLSAHEILGQIPLRRITTTLTDFANITNVYIAGKSQDW